MGLSETLCHFFGINEINVLSFLGYREFFRIKKYMSFLGQKKFSQMSIPVQRFLECPPLPGDF